MTIKLKLFITCVVTAALMAGVGAFVYSTLGNLKSEFTAVADKASEGEDNAMTSSQELVKSDQYLKQTSSGMKSLVKSVDEAALEVKVLQRKVVELRGALEEVRQDIELSTDAVPEGDALYALEDAVDALGDIEETVKREMFVYLSDTVVSLGDFSTAIKSEVENVAVVSDEISIVRLLSESTAAGSLAIKDRAQQFFTEIEDLRALLMKAFGGVTLLLVLGLIVLSRSILRPLGAAFELASRIAKGDLDIDVDQSGKDEIGRLFVPLAELIERMQKETEEAEGRANEATRIRRALDNAASSVMMTDLHNEIVYLNHSAESMFQALEADDSDELRGFSHAKLIGQKVHQAFHSVADEPALQATAEEDSESMFTIGSRIFQVIPAPVRNSRGDRIGTALEWKDKTVEIGIQNQVEKIVTAAQNGDLSQRIPVQQFGGDSKNEFFAVLGRSLNDFIERVSSLFGELDSVTSAMASGDLTRSMDGEYEGSFLTMQENVNASLRNLQVIVESVRDASQELQLTASDITKGNESLSVRTEQQSVSLVETAQTLEELTTGIESNTDSAIQANELAATVRDRANADSEVVVKATKAMESINEASGKIGEIISVINEIAFQTNLLAINASVEAARAGEQGRGFAVVASEVRNLAERSAASASEISTLIQDSIEKVGLGTELVNASGDTMNELMEAVKQLGGLVDSITNATIEQASGTGQIGEIVDQMETITQDNASLAEKTADDAKTMYAKTEYLTQLIGKFRVA